MSWNNYLSKVKKYFWFNKLEFRAFFVSVVVFAFVWSLNNGRIELENFLVSLVLVGVVLFVHHSGQRLWGLRLGFRVEQKLWWYGIIISLILAFISFGSFKFLAASSTLIFMLQGHRLGAFRYGPNLKDYAAVCLAGPVSCILFGVFFKQLSTMGLFPVFFADSVFKLCLILAVCNLVPVPPLDGSRILYSSRLFFAFLFGAVAGYVALFYFFQIYSFIFAVLIGVLVWFLFYVFFEMPKD